MARILICDDSPFMRTTIRGMLEKAGHEIIAEAENPQDATAIYEKKRPDLVTMDLLMKTWGYEGVKAIRKFDPVAKIIIVSVLSEQQAEVIEAIRAGALGIVPKPIKCEVLLGEVDRVLQKK